jgi:hypothetical protein
MSTKEQVVNFSIRYGAIVVLVCAVANIYVVLKHIELSRNAAKADNVFQQADAQRRAFDGVLRDFAGRAGNDAVIRQIFQRNQAQSPAPAQP